MSSNWRVWTAGLCIGLAIAAFVTFYVSIEHPAYYWDWGGYFGFYKRDAAQLLADPLTWLLRTFLSIRFLDYNPAAVVPLLPVNLLFGDGRLPYVLAIVFLYLLPTVLISARLSLAGLTEPERASTLGRWLVTGVALLFVPYWQATMRGMPDIVGLIPLGLATLLVIRSDFLTAKRIQTALLLGLLLWLTFLFRRWYAYACIGLVVATVVVMFARGLARREPFWPFAIRTATTMAIVAAVAANLLMLFQGPLALRILSTPYRDIYAGYQLPPLDQLWLYYSRLGPLYSLLLLAGLALAAWSRNIPVLFMALAALVTGLTFGTTQAPWTQHALPIYLWIVPAIALAVHRLVTVSSSWQPARAAAAIAILLVTFAGSFMPATASWPLFQQLAAPQRYFPLHLEQLSTYRQLTADLTQLADSDASITILASGDDLSDSLLVALDPRLEPGIVPAAQVDERDGFWIHALRADYAVIANPVPIHLRAGSQTVITIPAGQILQRTGLGAAYQPAMGPYLLDGGHTAWIYRRTRAITTAEIEQLAAELAIGHPGWHWDGADWIGSSLGKMTSQ